MNNNRLYIIHPLETYGDEEENRKEEQEIAKFLRKNTDFELVRPFRMIPSDTSRGQALSYCIQLLCSCDNVILTGDWQKSKGCAYEIMQIMDQNIYELKDWEIKRINE